MAARRDPSYGRLKGSYNRTVFLSVIIVNGQVRSRLRHDGAGEGEVLLIRSGDAR